MNIRYMLAELTNITPVAGVDRPRCSFVKRSEAKRSDVTDVVRLGHRHHHDSGRRRTIDGDTLGGG